MRILNLVVSLNLCDITNATNNYLSLRFEENPRIGQQALNPVTTWKSNSELNDLSNKPATDSIFLSGYNKIFPSTITTVSNSCTSRNPIKISVSHIFLKPVIAGLKSIKHTGKHYIQ